MINVAINTQIGPWIRYGYDIVGFWEGSSVPMKKGEPLPDGPCQVRNNISQGFNFSRGSSKPPTEQPLVIDILTMENSRCNKYVER